MASGDRAFETDCSDEIKFIGSKPPRLIFQCEICNAQMDQADIQDHVRNHSIESIKEHCVTRVDPRLGAKKQKVADADVKPLLDPAIRVEEKAKSKPSEQLQDERSSVPHREREAVPSSVPLPGHGTCPPGYFAVLPGMHNGGYFVYPQPFVGMPPNPGHSAMLASASMMPYMNPVFYTVQPGIEDLAFSRVPHFMPPQYYSAGGGPHPHQYMVQQQPGVATSSSGVRSQDPRLHSRDEQVEVPLAHPPVICSIPQVHPHMQHQLPVGAVAPLLMKETVAEATKRTRKRKYPENRSSVDEDDHDALTRENVTGSPPLANLVPEMELSVEPESRKSPVAEPVAPSQAPAPASKHASSYACDFCHSEFSSTLELVSHVNTSHKVLTIQCLSCDRKFGDVPAMRRHETRVHREVGKKPALETPVEMEIEVVPVYDLSDLDIPNSPTPVDETSEKGREAIIHSETQAEIVSSGAAVEASITSVVKETIVMKKSSNNGKSKETSPPPASSMTASELINARVEQFLAAAGSRKAPQGSAGATATSAISANGSKVDDSLKVRLNRLEPYEPFIPKKAAFEKISPSLLKFMTETKGKQGESNESVTNFQPLDLAPLTASAPETVTTTAKDGIQSRNSDVVITNEIRKKTAPSRPQPRGPASSNGDQKAATNSARRTDNTVPGNNGFKKPSPTSRPGHSGGNNPTKQDGLFKKPSPNPYTRPHVNQGTSSRQPQPQTSTKSSTAQKPMPDPRVKKSPSPLSRGLRRPVNGDTKISNVASGPESTKPKETDNKSSQAVLDSLGLRQKSPKREERQPNENKKDQDRKTTQKLQTKGEVFKIPSTGKREALAKEDYREPNPFSTPAAAAIRATISPSKVAKPTAVATAQAAMDSLQTALSCQYCERSFHDRSKLQLHERLCRIKSHHKENSW